MKFNKNNIVICITIIIILYVCFFTPIVVVDTNNERIIYQPIFKPVFNMRTRGSSGTWNKIGLVHSDSSDDNSIFELFSRPFDSKRGKFYYQVRDKSSGLTIPINENHDMDELYKDDKISILGKEGLGQFNVFIDSQSSAYDL